MEIQQVLKAKLPHMLVLRLGLALLSSGVFAFLSQIAVFSYTRSVNAPIPAGDIIGLTPTAFSVVIGVCWFALLLFLPIFRSSYQLLKSSKEDNNLSFLSQPNPKRILLLWVLIPFYITLSISIFFILSPTSTAYLLRFLGYGGGMSFCDGNEQVERQLVLMTDSAAYLQATDKIITLTGGMPDGPRITAQVLPNLGYIKVELTSGTSALCTTP